MLHDYHENEVPGPAPLTPEMSLNLLFLSVTVHVPAGRGLLEEGPSWDPELAHLAGGRRIPEPGGQHGSNLPADAHTGPVSV